MSLTSEVTVDQICVSFFLKDEELLIFTDLVATNSSVIVVLIVVGLAKFLLTSLGYHLERHTRWNLSENSLQYNNCDNKNKDTSHR